MKYLKVVSDLHLEFSPMEIPSHPDDRETLLVLAGDITLAVSAAIYNSPDYEEPASEDAVPHSGPRRCLFNTLKFLRNISGRFGAIVAIAGNHEFYHSDISRKTYKTLYEFYGSFGISFLENDIAQYDMGGTKVMLFGSTGWTDFRDNDPLVSRHCYMGMNDFSVINDSENRKPVTVQEIYDKNLIFRDRLRHFIANVEQARGVGETVVAIVITHHLPSMMSVHKRFANASGNMFNLNYAYANHRELPMDGVDIWLHGHTHDSCNYTDNKTVVICNPRGYHRDLGDGYTASVERDRDTDFDVNMKVRLEDFV